jgi:hypothetical protein
MLRNMLCHMPIHQITLTYPYPYACSYSCWWYYKRAVTKVGALLNNNTLS